jgi:hypothetical protein
MQRQALAEQRQTLFEQAANLPVRIPRMRTAVAVIAEA